MLPLDASGTSVALTRVFPRIRSYGVEFAIPMPWIALKGEGSYFTSPDDGFDEYGLYVLEIERQVGEWLLTAGYAGETRDSGLGARGSNRIAFDPERGLARSLIGRVSYTVDPRRTIALETVVRQDGDGFYLKGEYSQGLAEHWRATFKQIIIAGEETDFIGQFHRNSHFLVALRFSY